MATKPGPIPAPPTNEAEAVEAVAWCLGFLGGGFHPDTSGDQYVYGDRTATFTDDEAEAFDRVRDGIFAHLADPYETTLDLANRVQSCVRGRPRLHLHDNPDAPECFLALSAPKSPTTVSDFWDAASRAKHGVGGRRG